jgi:Acyl-coenzyme A synthetases/AMP-(fatty) acid ligases
VRAGVISGRCLGAAVEAYDEDGKPVTGQVGELVITQPMPSMPVGFWNDPGRRQVPGELLRHVPGDLAARRLDRDPAGRRLHHLRPLDATLNRGGVRMGTSEFYRAVEAFGEVADTWWWTPAGLAPRAG